MKTDLHKGWEWHPFLSSEIKRYNEQPDSCGYAIMSSMKMGKVLK